MTYKIVFINCPPVVVRATNRGNAITVAVQETRGHLSATEQRRNVISTKIYDK